jgi:hypothetical protein
MLNNISNVNRKDINSLILLLLTVLISISLLIGGLKLYIITLPTLKTIFILVLISINWQKSNYLRKGILQVSLLVLFTILIGLSSVDYLNSDLLRLISVVLGTITIANIPIKPRVMNIITYIMLGMLILYFVRSFGYINSYNSNFSDALSITLANPNSKGIVTLITYFIADRGKFMRIKIMRILLPLIAIITLYNYSSRASLLCALIYLFFTHLYIIDSLKKRKLTYIFVSSASLLFPLIYEYYFNASTSINKNFR